MTSTPETLRDRIIRAINSQKQKTITVLSCLLAVEDELGYIPEEAMEEVSILTDVTINDVWGVASFYTNFQFQPSGLHKVEICWGPTCHILGAMGVIEEVLKSLGLSGEGTTDDGMTNLRLNTCLGACSNGPVMSVDHRLIGRVSPQNGVDIVNELNAEEQSGKLNV